MVDLFVSMTVSEGDNQSGVGPDPVVLSDPQTGKPAADVSSPPTKPEHVSRSSDTSEASSLMEAEDAKKVC